MAADMIRRRVLSLLAAACLAACAATPAPAPTPEPDVAGITRLFLVRHAGLFVVVADHNYRQDCQQQSHRYHEVS